ncbi:hypothetical protein [Rhodoplanes sp. Z2-YC6860]|uniref:hypothetical protein n=1 Tax=Rhodoplanes sp. Z2-YC6860 TaxID=674703 RepID=UPI0012EDDBDE|nr:hypothetical protein [Rhodoplanes sp. Z2-YC6860]
MRTALLTGAAAAAFALAATAAARAETLYVADMDAVAAPALGYVYDNGPDYVVQDRSYVVVAPPRERVVVVPRREVIVDQPAYVAPRETVVAPRGGYYTTGYSTGGCMIDSRGFERCY